MLINILKHKIRPKGIIHVGAHWGQEYDTYVIKMGCPDVVFIEPCSAAFAVLHEKFSKNKNVSLVNTACGSKIGTTEINIERSNQGQSNSILKMGTHLTQHPGIEFVDTEIVTVTPLDFLYTDGCDFLMIDVQGFEGEVLKGATETLKRMQWVYCEVNREEVYKGCLMVNEIDEILNEFTPIETQWVGGWGDRLYKRK